MSDAQFNECAFNDRKVELSVSDRYKGHRGQTDRLAFISRTLLRGNRHYVATSKRVFRCLTESADKPAICCEKLGAPEQRFAVAVFRYATDQEGEILDSSTCKGSFLIWLISEPKYKELGGCARQIPLLDEGFDKPQGDLIVKCTEEKFQKLSLLACNCAHWKKNEAWYKALSAKASQMRWRLNDALGKKLPESEVREILGLASWTQPAMQTAGDIDLSDIVSGVPKERIVSTGGMSSIEPTPRVSELPTEERIPLGDPGFSLAEAVKDVEAANKQASALVGMGIDLE